jgi:hypothetical protein
MRALVRSAIAIGINKLEPSNLPRDYVRRMWPGDRDVPLILRAAISPARTADVPLAAVATAFLAALVPVSAGADLLKRGLSLNFDGVASISIPSLGVPAASFVAEDEAIPVQEAPGQPAKLTRHKLACICEATSEVPHDPNAEALIREILVASTGPALDRALLSNTPADDERPAGLFNRRYRPQAT